MTKQKPCNIQPYPKTLRHKVCIGNNKNAVKLKVTRHLCCKITPLLQVSLNKDGLAAELLREMCKGGLIFA